MLKDPRSPDQGSPFGYYVDTLGRRYKKDNKGMVIRKSNRPPYIPTQSWCAANSKQRQRWLLEYEKSNADEAAQPSEDGAVHGSASGASAAAAAVQQSNKSRKSDALPELVDGSDSEDGHVYDEDIKAEFDRIEMLSNDFLDSVDAAADASGAPTVSPATAAATALGNCGGNKAVQSKINSADPPELGSTS